MRIFCRRNASPFSAAFEFGLKAAGNTGPPLRGWTFYAMSAPISAACGLDPATGAFHLPFGPGRQVRPLTTAGVLS
jgi:hypothetical protein